MVNFIHLFRATLPELKARYVDIEILEDSLVQPELLYFVSKITKEAVDTKPTGDVDENENLVH